MHALTNDRANVRALPQDIAENIFKYLDLGAMETYYKKNKRLENITKRNFRKTSGKI